MVCCINGTRKSAFEGACETIEDTVVELLKPKFDRSRFTRKEWNALPKRILYRMIRYRVPGCEAPITIVTTLTDRQRFTAEDIAELYGLRWDVEIAQAGNISRESLYLPFGRRKWGNSHRHRCTSGAGRVVAESTFRLRILA